MWFDVCVGVLVQSTRSTRVLVAVSLSTPFSPRHFFVFVDLSFPGATRTIATALKKWWELHVTTGITLVHRTEKNAVWRLVPLATTTWVSDLNGSHFVPVIWSDCHRNLTDTCDVIAVALFCPS